MNDAETTSRAVVDTRVREQFDELLRTDFRSTAIGTVALGAIGIGFGVLPLLWICAVGGASGLLRQLGRRPLQRGNLQLAVALFAVGMWTSAMFSVAVLPIGLPVMLFNILVPVILGATYLDDREHMPIAIGTVVAAGVLCALGIMQDGLRLEDRAEEWVVNGSILGFMVGHTWMFTATVRDANRTRVDTLERALEANDDLLVTQGELRRSRSRLVDVADRERGRIERDIHDGAQQRLVSAAVQLRLAAQLVDSDRPPSPQATAETMNTIHGEVTAALDELRELASGIFPSLLAERGLAQALSAACRRSPLHVSLTIDDALAPANQIALAVYFVCLESLQNAAKHAGPDASVSVVVEQSDDGELLLVVSDNGVGFDAEKSATSRGLLNMSDRIAAVNGTLSISSALGEGTTVRARVSEASHR